jgi:hypothetical protein
MIGSSEAGAASRSNLKTEGQLADFMGPSLRVLYAGGLSGKRRPGNGAVMRGRGAVGPKWHKRSGV